MSRQCEAVSRPEVPPCPRTGAARARGQDLARGGRGARSGVDGWTRFGPTSFASRPSAVSSRSAQGKRDRFLFVSKRESLDPSAMLDIPEADLLAVFRERGQNRAAGAELDAAGGARGEAGTGFHVAKGQEFDRLVAELFGCQIGAELKGDSLLGIGRGCFLEHGQASRTAVGRV